MLKDDFFKDIDYNRLPPEPGRLLISEPFLYDTFFKRTVVLLVENNEEGAVGFILNKPINLKLNELVEGFFRKRLFLYNRRHVVSWPSAKQSIACGH